MTRFNPRTLFAASEPGAWYDTSDLSTLWQDSAGTVPVTAVEQPVGRILDKSGRGNHATQATTTKRPIYSRRVNLLLATATLATQSITTLAASHRLTFSGAGSITLSGTASGVFGAGTHTIACTAGTLTLTVAGAVNDADLRLATDAHLPYQWVNTATDYDADPAKFPAYLRFDGVDDALQTGNINFTSTDKMTVWSGVNSFTQQNGSAIGTVVLHPDTGFSSFYIYTPVSVNNLSFTSTTSTAIGTAGSVSTIATNSNAVVAGIADLATRTATLRANGVQLATNTAASGGGNYRNGPLYIGGQPTPNRHFNGRLYSLIVRGAQSTLSQIEATELYTKQKMRLP